MDREKSRKEILMDRKFTLFFVLLALTLVTLACGLGGGAPEPTAEDVASATATARPDDQPVASSPTPPSAESESGTQEGKADYDTVFPLPDDVQNFTGEGGEDPVNFQTNLGLEEVVEFYRQAFAKKGLTEYEVLTSIEDEGFSMVFTGWPNGLELVIQGVDLGESTNVNIRLEEVVDAASSAPADTALGEELRSDYGGFACVTIPGYTTEEAFGFVSMEAPDADPEIGPAILLMGSVVEDEADEEGATAQELYDQFLSDIEVGMNVSEPREITVDGIAGLVCDVDGASEGKEMAGRIVFVAVTPVQRFTALGAAPRERWESELAPLFDSVVASLSFFEPDLSFDLGEEEVGVGGEMRQWASTATASSEFGNPDQAATQATGAPDTFECQDLPTAWCPADYETVEWLELGYDVPVRPTEVNIMQTYSPDQVAKVELIDTDGTYHEVYTAEPVNLWEECLYTLSIPVEADYQAAGVRITVDQSVLDMSYCEIDAVELVGVSE
jgi:hypothetical protein